jgi:NADPH-dependent 2,4-dienoyl-CoA reductase/sulfur reductase-like enzyme
VQCPHCQDLLSRPLTTDRPGIAPAEADHYDLVVVGGGPAGEKGAAQAAYFGKRVVVVERSSALGGELAASALTTKAMREAALYLTGFRRRDVYGGRHRPSPSGRPSIGFVRGRSMSPGT